MSDQNTGNTENKNRMKKFWEDFEKKHPKLAKWLYQIFYFFVFSMGVTLIQYLFFTFTFRSALYLEPPGVQCTL